jgi:hypothetical protein
VDPVRAVEAQCKETLAAIERVIASRTRSVHVRAILHYVRERLNQLERTM